MTDNDRLVAAYSDKVTIKLKRSGERSYVRVYYCPRGHAHKNMVAACLCVERAAHIDSSGAQS